MISYDFPRILGKSGVYLIQPPKICAGLLCTDQKASAGSASTPVQAEVWRCWKEMRNRHIAPTPITLGCMVEAVVSNGDTEGAFDLIHTMEQVTALADTFLKAVFNDVHSH